MSIDSRETNKAIVRPIYEQLINQEDRTVIDQVMAANVVVHDPLMGTVHGADAFRQLMSVFDSAFPGHRVTVENIIAEDDYVCVLHTHHATHRGLFMGLPATGKQVEVSGVELFRVLDDKIVEFWRKDDDVSLLIQLGALPMPQAA